MRVLFLNRRDIGNPSGGGAELYTHEIARGLKKEYGCDVVVFSCRFRNSAPEETIDGVRYVRKGNEVTVHIWGFLYAVGNRNDFDRIIDQFNGIGFFTFFLKKTVLLIHQLYKEFWLRELGAAGVVPYMLEPLFLRLYRKRPAITVSPSTRSDLEKRGFRNIRIVMNAVRTLQTGLVLKDIQPTMVFLGRLRSTKRPEDALKIFRRVKERIPDVRLWIMGAGPLEKPLRESAKGLQDISFCGWVNDEQKFSLLSRARVLVVPGVREGFGINVIEAAAAGCPAVGYNVPGLRDSIRDGETGYLAGSPEEAADRIADLLSDRGNYERLSRNCVEYAAGFDWRKRVEEFWDEIRGDEN